MRKFIVISAVLLVVVLCGGLVYRCLEKTTFAVFVDNKKVIKESSFNLTSEAPLSVKVDFEKMKIDYDIYIERNKDLDFTFEQDGLEKRYSELEIDYLDFFIIEKNKNGFNLRATSYDLVDILSYGNGKGKITVNRDIIPHKPFFIVTIKSKTGDYTVSFGLFISDIKSISVDKTEIVF